MRVPQCGQKFAPGSTTVLHLTQTATTPHNIVPDSARAHVQKRCRAPRLEARAMRARLGLARGLERRRSRTHPGSTRQKSSMTALRSLDVEYAGRGPGQRSIIDPRSVLVYFHRKLIG